MPAKPVANAIKWAQRFPCETLQITSDGPSGFLCSFVNIIGGAQTCRQYLLPMLLDGPSVFLGSSANYFGWAQCFLISFVNNIG